MIRRRDFDTATEPQTELAIFLRCVVDTGLEMVRLEHRLHPADAAIDQHLVPKRVAEPRAGPVAFTLADGEEPPVGQTVMIPFAAIVAAFELKAEIPAVKGITVAELKQ